MKTILAAAIILACLSTAITSDFNSMSEVTLYGQVEKDTDSYTTHLRVLGPKVAKDGADNAAVDW